MNLYTLTNQQSKSNEILLVVLWQNLKHLLKRFWYFLLVLFNIFLHRGDFNAVYSFINIESIELRESNTELVLESSRESEKKL